MDNKTQNFNSKLKGYRKQLGLTQQQFADAVGMTRSNYAHLESEGNPSPEVLMRLSSVLKISIDDILGNSLPDDSTQAEILAAQLSGSKVLHSPDVFDKNLEKHIAAVMSPPINFDELDPVEREIIVNYRIMNESNRRKIRNLIVKIKSTRK